MFTKVYIALIIICLLPFFMCLLSKHAVLILASLKNALSVFFIIIENTVDLQCCISFRSTAK